jgi:hypothetical protein
MRIVFMMLALLAFVSCSKAPKVAHQDTVVTEDNDMLKSDVISFEHGSAALTDSSKESLRALCREARSHGEIDEIKLAVWSDRDVPVNVDLPKVDRNLAKQRIDNISNFLKDEFDVGDVDSFNMAERSNWLARLFRTDDAELKSSYAKADRRALNDDELRVMKSRGSPSSAVVIVRQDLD